jgi:threonine dehydrogenase-like Zn-dependent dehydrogenase
MKALQMTDSIPRYALTKGAAWLRGDAFWGPLACLRYRDIEPPALPNGEWLRVRTLYGGICGSDISTITLHASTTTTVFTSFPFTLGHENVGVISELGPGVDPNELRVGQRVVIDPLLSYTQRGLENPDGIPANLCQGWDQGTVSEGLMIGFCRDTGGSWSEEFVAHRSQVLPVPEQLSDEEAVLAEPFAVSLHAVLQNMPSDDDTVLIIGGGVIGLCAIAALRGLGSKARIIVIARYTFQAEEAQRLGADVVLGRLRGKALEQKLIETFGARSLKPVLGPNLIVGGANVVFDCVGSASSFEQAIRFAGSGGTVVLIGLAGKLDGIDWTPVWLNELTIRGAFTYAMEEWQGERISTMALALRLMAEKKVDLAPLVTHRFRLDDYKHALATVTSKGNSGVIKAVFDFRGTTGAE